MRLPIVKLSLLALLATACGAHNTETEPSGLHGSSSGSSGSTGKATSGSTGSSGGSTGTTASSGGGSSGSSGSACTGSTACVAATCSSPIAPAATSHATVVGTGTAASCTEAAFTTAVEAGGVITFNCGGPATIPITTTKNLRTDVDTVIDGGGLVTLDGGHRTRLLSFHSPNFRAVHSTVTLQHLTLVNGKATGTPLPTAPPPCSQGSDLDGSGGAIFVRDGVLHIIDSVFRGNEAEPLGPDVAGGAVYAVGSLEVTIVGSRFENNRASNGGAVGSLFSNLTLVNDAFIDNEAQGSGANYIDSSCPVNGGESGNGGNGGAVVIDGGEAFAIHLCGLVFSGNHAGALGGGIFRTPDLDRQATLIDRTTFDRNTAVSGGGAMYFHHSDLTLTASTYSNNSAPGAGAIQADDTELDATNVTFAGNQASHGLGGAIALFGNGGTLLNCTFAHNSAPGGSGLFGAAIAGGTALTIRNTIFDDNTSQDCGAPMACSDGNSGGSNNLQFPAQHAVCDGADPACASGTTFADPKLGPLADHGGPTQTLAPAAGSPALGQGQGCPATDQRGHARPANGCTLGAYQAD